MPSAAPARAATISATRLSYFHLGVLFMSELRQLCDYKDHCLLSLHNHTISARCETSVSSMIIRILTSLVPNLISVLTLSAVPVRAFCRVELAADRSNVDVARRQLQAHLFHGVGNDL